jgi:predicted nucleotidyltransferase
VKNLLSVVVGSRLHGLNNEKSDYDIRGIFVNDLREVFSPYKKPKNTSWVEGEEDNTSYELREFCKLATQGNATILEILYSDMIREDTLAGIQLQANAVKFLDSERIFEAHKGYAHNQYTKMSLFTPDKRTPKFVVAYYRVMLQAIQILEHGNYDGWLTDEYKVKLLDIKYNWRPELIEVVSKDFAQLQVELADVHTKNYGKYKPDLEWIEDFCYRAYTSQLQQKNIMDEQS